MAKKRLLYFALGATAAGAALFLLRKYGGLHISIDVEPSDAEDWKPEPDADIALDDADVDVDVDCTVTIEADAEAESNAEVN